MPKLTLAVLTVAATGALAGCMVGPDYATPKSETEAKFAETAPPPTTRPGGVVTDRTVQVTEWWTTFRDPKLEGLIGRAKKGSLDLRQAASRVRSARAQRGVNGTGLLPNLNADGGYQRALGSRNIVFPAGALGGGSGGGGSGGGGGGASSSAGRLRPQENGNPTSVNNPQAGGPASPLGLGGFPGVETDLYQVGFDSTWEIDVFGGQRRSIEATVADEQAAQEDQRDALVTLYAEVARNYITLRGQQRQLQIARENLDSQQQSLRLTRSRFDAGFVTELDVARQATQVSSTAATLPSLDADIHVTIHAIGVLLGESPDALLAELTVDGPIPSNPPEVPIGLPSDLLRRRPDIRRAERQVAAATARVGAATADLYPKFSITGALGFDTFTPKHILDWRSKYWALSPGVSWPIFDSGRIRFNIQVQNEAQGQAVTAYQQAILTAMRDVEDALVRYSTEQLRRQSLSDAVKTSQQAVDLASQQYTQGIVDQLTVLDAERTKLASEDALARSDSAIATDLVALYKALGGGWEVEMPEKPVEAVPIGIR